MTVVLVTGCSTGGIGHALSVPFSRVFITIMTDLLNTDAKSLLVKDVKSMRPLAE